MTTYGHQSLLFFSTAPLVRKPQTFHCPCDYENNDAKRAFCFLLMLKGDSNANLCLIE